MNQKATNCKTYLGMRARCSDPIPQQHEYQVLMDQTPSRAYHLVYLLAKN